MVKGDGPVEAQVGDKLRSLGQVPIAKVVRIRPELKLQWRSADSNSGMCQAVGLSALGGLVRVFGGREPASGGGPGGPCMDPVEIHCGHSWW